MIKTIFWDFDGVIAESVNVKTEAFVKMYSAYSNEIQEKIKEYHLKNGGISRFEKFKYFETQLLKKEMPLDSRLKELGDTFSEYVLEGVLNAPFVNGVIDAIKVSCELAISNYVVSGTPTEEIRYIVSKRGLSHYFKDVYGSPMKKSEITSKIILENRLSNEECLFIGDATSDMQAATDNNIIFLLRRNNENSHLFASYKGLSIKDFIEFSSLLKKISI